MSDADEILTIKQVARYLKVNERAVYKLAQEGTIPTVKIANQWRFRRSMIDGWLDLQMSSHLRNANGAPQIAETEASVSIADAVRPGAIRLDLDASTKGEAIDELAGVLTKNYTVRDPAGFRQAVHNRERLCSTAIIEQVALPHPRYNGSRFSRDLAIAVGRSRRGIDFGSLDGNPTRLVVMLCAPSDAVHLQVIAKLGRLMSDPVLRHDLLGAPGREEFIDLIRKRETP
jgi:PTS system nitrogen regulatory IIA component